jgi:hypothetical protein
MGTSKKTQVARYEKAKLLLVAAFRKRWKDTLDGKLQIETADVFEAPTDKDRQAMAKRFYDPAHLEKLLSLSDDKIERNLLPLVRYLTVQRDEPLRQSLVERMISCQYILFDADEDKIHKLGSGSEVDFDDGDMTGWKAAGYPESAMYDDWYERVGGFNSTFTGVLMKVSGEPFSKAERHHLARSVYGNVLANDSEELWSFGFHLTLRSRNQIVVSVSNFSPDYSYALDSALDFLSFESAKRIAADVEPLRSEKDSSFSRIMDPATPNLRRTSRKVIVNALRQCIRGTDEASDLNEMEEVIGPHLFDGREYFHSYLEGTLEFGQVEFFDAI